MFQHFVFRGVCIFLTGSMLLLYGCATPNSAATYSSNQAQREQIVRMGVVQSVREVLIDPGQSGVGAIAGAAVGGLAANSNIGKGTGALVSGVLGAIAGGVAGSAIEGAVRKQKALEITVKLDSGELRAITQAADQVFNPGDRVRLLTGGDGVTRVTY